MASSEPPHDATFHRVRRNAQWVALVVGSVSWLYLVASLAMSSERPGAASVLVTAGSGCFFTAAATTMVSRRQERSLQVETRARVREAEQDLEDALRSSASRRFILVPDDDPRLNAASGQPATATPHPPTVTPASAGISEELDQQQARLTLSELWAVTHRRLDHYHGIALGQAKQSFRNAQIAMGIGFILLVAFATVAWKASTVAGSVVAGGLGAVAAALAGYVSRTFIRSQEAAAGHLRAYFDQPLEFSRYLAAERLMSDAGLSEERRAEVLSLLVQAMIAGPSPQTPAAPNEQLPGNAV